MGRTEKRAQSETIGFVLVIAMVITGSLLVVGLGAIAIGNTEDQLSAERAEKALTQFDSKAALVALGQSASHDASFGTDVTGRNELSVEQERGWLRVTVTNRSDGSTTEVVNITELGAVVYEGDDVQLAYQGGGVWRQDSQGGQMLSPPEFHYRGATLVLPAINVTGGSVLNDDVVIQSAGTVQHHPDPARNLVNPVGNSVINVTVGSEFYRAWGQYFVERTDGEVRLDDENKTVNLTLASPIGDITAESVVAGQASGGTLTLQGNPQHPCHSGGSTTEPYADSYNSSEGSYCDQYDPDRVTSAGDITFGNDIRTESASGGVQGDLIAGGDTRLHGNAPIHGNISYTGECVITKGGGSDCSDAQADDSYSVEEIGGVSPSTRIDFAIDNTVKAVHESGSSVNLGEGSGETATLEAGEYYTDSLTLTNGESATLDTSDGDITLVVNSSIELLDDANLTVIGENNANIYVDGAGPGTDELLMQDSVVFAPNNSAEKLTVLGRGTFDGTVEDSSYTGVIYAPVGTDGNGSMDVLGHLFGAVVTGDLTVGGTGGSGGGAGGTLHYDEQLRDQRVVPPDQTIIRLTFLHITENRIDVTG